MEGGEWCVNGERIADTRSMARAMLLGGGLESIYLSCR